MKSCVLCFSAWQTVRHRHCTNFSLLAWCDSPCRSGCLWAPRLWGNHSAIKQQTHLAAFFPCARIPEMLRQHEGSYFQSPTCSHPLPCSRHLGESKQNAHLCGDVHVEQVLGQRAAWKDQKSEFKTREPSQDVLGLLRTLGYFCPPLLLNRITLYPQRVLIGQDLPSTTCDQFQSFCVWALLFEG